MIYSPGTITQTMYYRAVLSCNSNSDSTNVDTVTVNSPVLLSTTPGSRCGYGQVTLGATTASSSINWYASNSPTDYTVLGTGTSFVTPNISTTTTDYAAATDGGANYTLGFPVWVGATTNSGYSDIGLMFDATQAFVLEVCCYLSGCHYSKRQCNSNHCLKEFIRSYIGKCNCKCSYIYESRN